MNILKRTLALAGACAVSLCAVMSAYADNDGAISEFEQYLGRDGYSLSFEGNQYIDFYDPAINGVLDDSHTNMMYIQEDGTDDLYGQEVTVNCSGFDSDAYKTLINPDYVPMSYIWSQHVDYTYSDDPIEELSEKPYDYSQGGITIGGESYQRKFYEVDGEFSGLRRHRVYEYDFHIDYTMSSSVYAQSVYPLYDDPQTFFENSWYKPDYKENYEYSKEEINGKTVYICHTTETDDYDSDDLHYSSVSESWGYCVIAPVKGMTGAVYSVAYGRINNWFEYDYRQSGDSDTYQAQLERDYTDILANIQTNLPILLANVEYTTDLADLAPPIEQEETTSALDDSGEDSGVEIDARIVDGGGETDEGLIDIGMAGAALAGGGMLALAAGQAINEAQKKKDKKRYKMYINKNFGNTIKKGEEPVGVFARIVEVQSNGYEVDCPKLTSQIEVYSGDGRLLVSDGGMSQNGYKTAIVSVPEDNKEFEGTVTFRYKGPGGTFTRNVVFSLIENMIMFTQPDIGIPAYYEKEMRIPFFIFNMPKDIFVKAGIAGSPYDVRVEKGDDPEKPDMWYAVVKDRETDPDKVPQGQKESYIAAGKCPKERPDAGTTDNYKLIVTANSSTEQIMGELPVLRIVLGLSLMLDTTAIGCYMKLRPGRENIRPLKAHDFEPNFTEAALLYIDWSEEDHCIVRWQVSPMPEQKDEAGNIIKKGLEVKAKRLVYSHNKVDVEADDSVQQMVDKLGIVAFMDYTSCGNGARRMRICTTKGSLDPPIRINAELTFNVLHKGEIHSISRDVLLRSQPFREFASTDEQMKAYKNDDHIEERLLHIRSLIYCNYMHRLYSLHDLVDRMIKGYDKRFGYDQNQLENVLKVWYKFTRGESLGANADAEAVTLADELAACYAFMQGLRDNTGFLGRMAMGIMTAGYSEYVFSTMTLAENIREAVFNSNGDEFGYWDAVIMGVKEFEMNILMDIAMTKGGGKAFDMLRESSIKNFHYDIIAIPQGITKAYQSGIKAVDQTLSKNIRLYKLGSEALGKVRNCLSSSARVAARSIEDTAEAALKAERYAATVNPKELSAKEYMALQRYKQAVADGKIKVNKLKAAQQRIAKSSGPAKAQARADYDELAKEVWTDKNALRQLQALDDPYAINMRAEFNRYRAQRYARIQEDALDRVAKATGRPREELYVMNASSNSEADILAGTKVPNDLDVTIAQKVYDQPKIDPITKKPVTNKNYDVVIQQSVGEEALALSTYKELMGVEAPDLATAKAFMKHKDITYVAPGKEYGYVIEFNREAYFDLPGMTDKSQFGRSLEGLYLNRDTVKFKGQEWYARAREAGKQAAEAEALAARSVGQAKQTALDRAKLLRDREQAYFVEGTRQITKVTNTISMARNAEAMKLGGKNSFTPRVLEMNAFALRVGAPKNGLSPIEFEVILKTKFGVTLEQYTEEMAACLV